MLAMASSTQNKVSTSQYSHIPERLELSVKKFGPKRDKVKGYWRKQHNEELHSLYSSPNIIRMIKSRRMRWAGHVERMGRRGMHIGCWWGSQKETGRQRRRWVDNIKIDLGEIGWDGMDWIDLAQDRDQWRSLVNTVMNFRVP
jgi:hypothetical protein